MYENWVGIPHTDPFFTDLSGLTLQSGVGVGPGGRLVKDEYTVGGGSTSSGAGVGVGVGVGVNVAAGMDVDNEMNQTIQHHPPPSQPPAPSNSQQTPQPFIPGMAPPNPGNFSSAADYVSFCNLLFCLVHCCFII